jgi:hypothetical protein
MTAYRWRQCPSCRTIMPAKDLRWQWNEDFWDTWRDGSQPRVCPRCGWLGKTADFAIVRDPEPQPHPRGGAA